MIEATLQLILEQWEELRKHIRGVQTNMKTENNVIQLEIKIEESALRNEVEDTL
jgi:hypothetical protein